MSRARVAAPKRKPAANRYNVEAVSRAARLLQQFTRAAPVHTIDGLAALTGISSDLVTRSMATLHLHGLVRSVDADEDSVALGYTWVQFADVRRHQFDIRFVALPVMRGMRDAVNETVILSISTAGRRVNIDYVESTQAIRRLTQLGFEVPLHVGATGRALLSALTTDELQHYFDSERFRESTRAAGVSASRILREVEHVRTQGYAVAFREITSDTAAVSAPIKDHYGRVVAAVTISCPDERFDDALRQRCIDCVLAGAAEVSRSLGYHAIGPGSR